MKLQFISVILLGLLSLYLNAQELYPTFEYRKAKDSVAWNRAWQEYGNSNYKDAIRTIEKLPRFYRHDPAANRLKAHCYIGLEDYPAALYWLGRAMLEAPDHYGLFYDRAKVWSYKHNYRAQAADLSAYLHFVKDDTLAVYNYVSAVTALNELEKATAVLEAFAFKDAGLHAELGNLYLRQGYFDAAYYALTAGLRLFPQDTDLTMYLTFAHLFREEHDLAMELAEQLIVMDSSNGYFYAIRGWIYRDMDRMFDARVSFELAEYYGYSLDDDDEGDYDYEGED